MALKPTYVKFDNLFLPQIFEREKFEYATTYKPLKDEIIVASYPKCGNTWVLNIVYHLLHEGNSVPEGKFLYKEYPYIDYEGIGIESISPPRVMKTHLPLNRFQYELPAKYIYVARNPKDCVVSFYHHTKGFDTDYSFAEGKFDDYFECFIEGEVDNNDFFDHINTWFAIKRSPNVLFLTYEQMKLDPKEAIISIANFIGGAAEELVKNTEKINQVIEKTSFSSMKKKEKQLQFEFDAKDMNFFRKGEVGDWHNFLSETQSKRIDEKFDEKIQDDDLKKIWRKYM